MNGSAGGDVRSETDLPLESADRSTGARSRVLDLLAREPFVVLVLSLDALILSFRPWLFVRSDTWLALVAGRLVWHNGLPHHEALTVWAHGKTWIDQQWLGQLALYGLDGLGGLRLLLLVHVVLLVTGFGLALAFARRAGASSRSVAALGTAGMLVALPNTVARTQTFGYVLFVLLFWLLASDVRSRSRRVWLALPLLVLWANLHGSVVLGVGLVAMWAAAGLMRLGQRGDGEAWRMRRRSIVLTVGALVAPFVSPYGLHLFGYYRSIFGANAFPQLVGEWEHPTFPAQLPFFALALAAFWLVARKPRRLSLFEHLAFVCMLLAGLDAVRNIVWFALVAVMVAPRALDDVWPVPDAPLRRQMNVGLSLGAIVLVLGSFVVAASHPSAWYHKRFPAGATAAVASVAGDPSVRVFANESYADWLLWEVPALSGRVAFDARFELLTSAQLHAVEHFRHQSSQDWLGAADGYRLLVLDPHVEKPAIRTVRRERGTRSLFRGRDAVVLLRARP